ncbi:MAG: glycosyltransferase [Acidobacteria bacterium]|nr:glycosyltransferase [Acidobacteriota bacterium]MBV9623921.1 glycosyltransferase [Acidobacteriota bacterium]
MRVLFVVPNVPSFIRPRPFNFIRHLSEKHQVSVVCLATNDADDRFISELREHCQRLEVIRVTRWRSLANCLAALFTANSLRCAYFYSPRLRDSVKARVEANEVDLVHAEHVKSLAMVDDVLGKVPAVFDAVDCLSMFESRRRRVTTNPLVKLFSWMESKKLAHLEAKAGHRFNRLAISSAIDREAYPVPAAMREKIDVVRNGVDLEHFRFRQFQVQENLLVFCAKLDYFPNQDAALYFAGSVWPVLRARRPELQLEIVGSRPPRSVRRLHGKNNIRVIGSVPDVRPYLGRAWVALCPIRIRAGIQFKLLEAMALGVPVVTTRLCCPGLGVEPGKHLLAAGDSSEFVSAVELLLDNRRLREELIAAGRAYVEQEHDWTRLVAALSQSYQEAVADFSGSWPLEASRSQPRSLRT